MFRPAIACPSQFLSFKGKKKVSAVFMSEHRHTEVCRNDVKIQMIPYCNCKNEKQTNRILVKSMCVPCFLPKSCTSGKICRQLKFLEEQGCL